MLRRIVSRMSSKERKRQSGVAINNFQLVFAIEVANNSSEEKMIIFCARSFSLLDKTMMMSFSSPPSQKSNR